MNRRTLVSTLALMPWLAMTVRAAANPPFRLALVRGGLTGDLWQAGVRLDLDDGWKTYWRMPGDSGIPPQFDWSGSTNVASVDIRYPLPARYHDASGETVGYKHRILYPVSVRLADPGRPAMLKLRLFFGTCRDICIPARAEASLDLATASGSLDDIALIDEWLRRVPRPVAAGEAGPVTSARVIDEDGVLSLVLQLARPVDDIFVEADSPAYFRAPEMAEGMARLAIDNVKDAVSLQGHSLTLTVAVAGSGVEQTLLLP